MATTWYSGAATSALRLGHDSSAVPIKMIRNGDIFVVLVLVVVLDGDNVNG